MIILANVGLYYSKSLAFCFFLMLLYGAGAGFNVNSYFIISILFQLEQLGTIFLNIKEKWWVQLLWVLV